MNISLLGIPHDENSSFMKGAAKAPPLIRHELLCDCYSSWSETGIDVCAAGRLIDHGDIQFDPASDPWDLIECQLPRARLCEVGSPDVLRQNAGISVAARRIDGASRATTA